jgi:hypothetical protein
MVQAIAAGVQAIGYVRRSTNRQEESLEQQREKLEAFAQARGWELVQVYADDAISGSQMQWPGLEALIAHAERDSEVGVVLAWERNRLARPKDPEGRGVRRGGPRRRCWRGRWRSIGGRSGEEIVDMRVSILRIGMDISPLKWVGFRESRRGWREGERMGGSSNSEFRKLKVKKGCWGVWGGFGGGGRWQAG